MLSMRLKTRPPTRPWPDLDERTETTIGQLLYQLPVTLGTLPVEPAAADEGVAALDSYFDFLDAMTPAYRTLSRCRPHIHPDAPLSATLQWDQARRIAVGLQHRHLLGIIEAGDEAFRDEAAQVERFGSALADGRRRFGRDYFVTLLRDGRKGLGTAFGALNAYAGAVREDCGMTRAQMVRQFRDQHPDLMVARGSLAQRRAHGVEPPARRA